MAADPRSADDRRGAVRAGNEAESLVAHELSLRGWRTVDRNWRGGGAELDLVVEREGAVRFVEVKARRPGVLSEAVLESISADKRRRLTRAAEAWLARQPAEPVEAAFMVACVDLQDWSIELLDDAFDAS